MKVLATWELGAGLGHIASLRPLLQKLADRGHDVLFASRDVKLAQRFVSGIRIRETPEIRLAHHAICNCSTYADLLFNHGYGHEQALHEIISQWRAIFEEESPDLALLDFSPSALLAAQGTKTQIALAGSGHYSPPDIFPLPDFFPERKNYGWRNRRTESKVLRSINAQLANQGQTPLTRVAELFSRVDANFLSAFSELEHYPGRSDGEFCGVWSDLGGRKAEWPGDQLQPKVLFYAKPFDDLAETLFRLDQDALATLVYVNHECLLAPDSYQHIRIVSEPIDIWTAAKQADVAIVHGGFGTTTQLLLAGVPSVQIPITGEQQIIGQRVEELGVGILVNSLEAGPVHQAVKQILAKNKFVETARRFGDKYANFDRHQVVEQIVRQLEGLGRSPQTRHRIQPATMPIATNLNPLYPPI